MEIERETEIERERDKGGERREEETGWEGLFFFYSPVMNTRGVDFLVYFEQA
jgi:hypothetical protein